MAEDAAEAEDAEALDDARDERVAVDRGRGAVAPAILRAARTAGRRD